MKKRLISMAMALLFIASLPISAFADTYYLDNGSIEITATAADNGTDTNYAVSQYDGSNWGAAVSSTEAPVIRQNESDNTETATKNTVTINVVEKATADVTIKNVNIEKDGYDQLVDKKDAAIAINAGNGAAASVTLDNVQIQVSKNDVAAISTSGAGDVIVDLNNQNTVKSGENRAGLEKNNTGSLTIDGNEKDGDSLIATGGDHAAGIGGGNDDRGNAKNVSGVITIQGGTVTGNGGTYGAGIGSGGTNGSGSGGDVTAITITGGTVTGNGGTYGAGIGSGSNYKGETSGDVTAITITGGTVTGNGGTYGAGIGSGSNTNGASSGNVGAIEITGGTVTGNGKDGGAGIGGGSNGNITTVSIKDATVVAVGSRGGAGIGGGYNGKLANSVVISGAANVTSEGAGITSTASGAAIGNGAQVKGTDVVNGDEAELDTSGIKNGIITLIANGKTTIITDIEPEADTASQTASPAVKSYSVVDKDGKDISYTAEVKDGVLTITVDADYAALTGTLAGMSALTAQGVESISFVTNGATSTFDLADLSAKGSGTYKLTHDGATVTFTLGTTDISEILK